MRPVAEFERCQARGDPVVVKREDRHTADVDVHARQDVVVAVDGDDEPAPLRGRIAHATDGKQASYTSETKPQSSIAAAATQALQRQTPRPEHGCVALSFSGAPSARANNGRAIC
jgi:hypothetical protein